MLNTTSPRNASRSYESVRRSTHDECVNACSARSRGSSSRSDLSESSASGGLFGDAAGHEVDDRSHGLHLGRLVVGDSDAIGVLELHEELDQVQRVGVQVVLEARAVADLTGVDGQLGGQVVPDALEHILPGHDPLPTLTAAADAEASEPPARSAASVGSTTPSSTARWASCTAVATPTGVASPWVTKAKPRSPSRIPAPTASWFNSSRRRRAFFRISSPPSVETGPERTASRTAPITVSAVPSTALSATLPVKPSVTITSCRPPAMSRPSTLPTKFSGPSLSTRFASTTSAVPFFGSSPTDSSPTRGR